MLKKGLKLIVLSGFNQIEPCKPAHAISYIAIYHDAHPVLIALNNGPDKRQ